MTELKESIEKYEETIYDLARKEGHLMMAHMNLVSCKDAEQQGILDGMVDELLEKLEKTYRLVRTERLARQEDFEKCIEQSVPTEEPVERPENAPVIGGEDDKYVIYGRPGEFRTLSEARAVFGTRTALRQYSPWSRHLVAHGPTCVGVILLIGLNNAVFWTAGNTARYIREDGSLGASIVLGGIEVLDKSQPVTVCPEMED